MWPKGYAPDRQLRLVFHVRIDLLGDETTPASAHSCRARLAVTHLAVDLAVARGRCRDTAGTASPCRTACRTACRGQHQLLYHAVPRMRH